MQSAGCGQRATPSRPRQARRARACRWQCIGSSARAAQSRQARTRGSRHRSKYEVGAADPAVPVEQTPRPADDKAPAPSTIMKIPPVTWLKISGRWPAWRDHALSSIIGSTVVQITISVEATARTDKMPGNDTNVRWDRGSVATRPDCYANPQRQSYSSSRTAFLMNGRFMAGGTQSRTCRLMKAAGHRPRPPRRRGWRPQSNGPRT